SARVAIASATHVPSTNTPRRSTAVEGSRGSARPAVTQNASSTRAAAVARRAWRAIRARRTREWAARSLDRSGTGEREVMGVVCGPAKSMRERVLDDVHRHLQRGLTLLGRIVMHLLVLEAIPEVAVE